MSIRVGRLHFVSQIEVYQHGLLQGRFFLIIVKYLKGFKLQLSVLPTLGGDQCKRGVRRCSASP